MEGKSPRPGLQLGWLVGRPPELGAQGAASHPSHSLQGPQLGGGEGWSFHLGSREGRWPRSQAWEGGRCLCQSITSLSCHDPFWCLSAPTYGMLLPDLAAPSGISPSPGRWAVLSSFLLPGCPRVASPGMTADGTPPPLLARRLHTFTPWSTRRRALTTMYVALGSVLCGTQRNLRWAVSREALE